MPGRRPGPLPHPLRSARQTGRAAAALARRQCHRQRSRSARHHLQRAVVVAMVTVRVMQMTIDQIVHVVAVGHGLMPTARAMHMAGLVTLATVLRRAGIGVGSRYGNHMLIHVVAMRVVQVAVVQVVNVAIMHDGRVAAVRAMLVSVVLVVRVVASGCSHGRLLSVVHQTEGNQRAAAFQGYSAAWCKMLRSSSCTCSSASA